MIIYYPLADIKDSKAPSPLNKMTTYDSCDTEEEAKSVIKSWTDFYGYELENIRIEVRDTKDNNNLVKTIFL